MLWCAMRTLLIPGRGNGCGFKTRDRQLATIRVFTMRSINRFQTSQFTITATSPQLVLYISIASYLHTTPQEHPVHLGHAFQTPSCRNAGGTLLPTYLPPSEYVAYHTHTQEYLMGNSGRSWWSRCAAAVRIRNITQDRTVGG